jgi:Tol biopolymer transport system component
VRRILFLLLALTGLTVNAAEPELFAISTPENELNAAFTPDGRTVYFTRAIGANGRFGVIVSSKIARDGKWSAAEVVSFSGQHSDYDPFVSPDGARLFFISKRPTAANESKEDFDIWFVDRTDDGWSAPQRLGAPINSDKDELYPAVASDGTLYFSSCGRNDSRGRCDLYRSRLRDGKYVALENLGDAVNSPASETDAYIAPDQSYLIFAAYGRLDAIGDGDLYVSTQRDGVWTAPRLLGPQFNTIAREYCPIVSPDGKYFYFTSQFGTADVPRSRAMTTAELRESLKSTRNGFGNVYRVPIEALGIR